MLKSIYLALTFGAALVAGGFSVMAQTTGPNVTAYDGMHTGGLMWMLLAAAA